MSIEIRNINKFYGEFKALSDVNLDIHSGELIALLGPSGCGKTTLLRIIAGLDFPNTGSILFSGEDTTHVHVRKRNVGFVFQHYALFRHMTVFENVAFGLRVRPRSERPSENIIKEKVHELLNLVQLDWLGDRYPSQLSGGQRQRIALARALAVEPQVLLLDEPFGALDAKVRKDLRRWLRELHNELNITTIFVTHDQEEALEVADRIVVMNKGVIEQVGSPQAVWDKPESPFVYGFLGDVNVFQGHSHDGDVHLNINHQVIDVDNSLHSIEESTEVSAFVRPYDFEVRRYTSGDDGIVAQLNKVIVVGPTARLELSSIQDKPNSPEQVIEVHLSAGEYQESRYKEGELLVLNPKRVKIFKNQASSHNSLNV